MYHYLSLRCFLVLSFLTIFSAYSTAKAQITPDTTLDLDPTLGDENSQLMTNEDMTFVMIEGGVMRGTNLFHSFQDFNVNNGQQVYFANPNGIESILSRVTGDQQSDISGTLGVDGPADLYFLNPNGITFGEGASLDIDGSFYATTAEAIELGEGVFSAIEPEQSTLLAVNPSVVFSNYLTNSLGEIDNQSELIAGENLTLAASQLNIQGNLLVGNNLTLLANNRVSIANSTVGSGNSNGDLLIQGESITIIDSLITMQGQGELGDITLIADETIELLATENNNTELSSLATNEGISSDILIIASDFRAIDSGGPENPGAVVILARGNDGGNSGNITIDVAGTAFFEGGFVSTLASGNENVGISGDIVINATNLELINGSGLFSTVSVGPDGTNSGDAGNVTINLTETLRLNGFGQFGDSIFMSSISTNASGNAGNIYIVAENIDMDDLSVIAANQNGGSEGAGNAGEIWITANQLQLRNGSGISSGTFGTGRAGNITLDIAEIASFIGVSSTGQNTSGIFSRTFGDGDGGNISIRAATLEVLDGADISAQTFGMGNAGNIDVEIVRNVRIDGLNQVTQNSVSSISAGNALDSMGDGSDIPTGDGGNIQITATNLEVTGGGQIASAINGTGSAGDIILDVVETVHVEGSANLIIDGTVEIFPSLITSSIQETGVGIGGDIVITANNLIVSDGAVLDASTIGPGIAGDVILTIAETAQFEGVAPDGFPSTAKSSIGIGVAGTGGDVIITAGSLEVLAGAQLDTSVFGTGTAGNIILNIQETARFEGPNPLMRGGFSSGASSTVEEGGNGAGGNVIINANNLEVLEGAQLGTTVFGTGEAGDIILDITDTARFSGSNPLDSNFFSSASSAVARDGSGSGGDIRITAENLDITNESFLSAENRGTGDTGTIAINLQGHLTAIDGDIQTISAETSGGSIEILAKDIRLIGDSDILTNVELGEGRGGDITLTADTIVALDDSDILAFSADGEGGNVLLNTPVFFGQDFQPSPQLRTLEELNALDGNDRVDVNATGRIASGTITTPEPNFIEDSFNELPSNLVNTATLIASSCVARRNNTESSFILTGDDGIAQNPQNDAVYPYSTGTIQTIPEGTSPQTLQEPESVYQLADGRLVLSRECG